LGKYMKLSQILQIIRARKYIVFGVFVSVVALAVSISLILPKKYTSSATILIDAKNPDPINGMVMQGAMLPGYIATQLDILRSDRVTGKVIQELKLDQSEQMRAQWTQETAGVGTFESWLAELLQKSLDVVPSRESSVINVAYTAVDPMFASIITNAFVRAYINTTLELRVEPAKQYSALFDEQAKQSRERLEMAQMKLSSYQQQKGIVATDERLDIESARLSELSNQLVALQAMSAESTSRRAQAGANISEVLNNPVVAGLKADLSRQESRLKELSASLGAAHPNVQQLQANINELRARVDAEVVRVTSSLTINSTVNRSREAQVKSALDAQREKVLKLKAQRDEASMLLADVSNAQRSYEVLQQRYAQTNLESQSNQTNVSVLKFANPSPYSSSPKIFLNTIVSIILGGLLGIGAALLRETIDKRIRTEDDVSLVTTKFLGQMPVALEAKAGVLLPVKEVPRLSKRLLPELIAPKKS
jgi:polysaccharide biosynthesis transport protein